MTTKDTPSEEPKPNEKKSEFDDETPGVHEHDKHRRHGYRGYPNNPDIGGEIHTGTGFTGAGPLSGGSSSGSDVFTDKTQEDVEERDEEKEK